MTKIYEVRPEHVVELADNMRHGDKKECIDILGMSPLNVIKMSIALSEWSYTGWKDGVLCITGVVPPSLIGDTAQPWLLTSNLMSKSPRDLIRFTKPFIAMWLDKWPRLVNYIDAEYKESLRWAKWGGFTVHDPEPYGVKQIPCCKVEIRRN